MTSGARALEGWPILVILLGVAASVAWTFFMFWGALQLLRWIFE